jgi:GTP-binding protein
VDLFFPSVIEKLNSDIRGMSSLIIRSVEFKGSFKNNEQCPQPEIPEFAFIGRSNVGKSSLINMLCNRKDLVRVSNKPGKTQSLNFFLVNDSFHFVDLPGYGYAKVSKAERKEWEVMIEDYLRKRKQLTTVFQLIDIRLTPQKIDIEFTNSLGEWLVPFVLAFTKADKLSVGAGLSNVKLYENVLKKTWETVPDYVVTSAEKRTGKEEIFKAIEPHLSAPPINPA